jgi:xylulokinase
MPGYLCTFDIGTSGVKAGILALDGRILASSYREYGILSPNPCWSEQSIGEMWAAQCEASREVLSVSHLHPKDIAALSVSCQRGTFAALNLEGKPLTNFIGWQDIRSIEECEHIRSIFGDKRYYDIAGLAIEPTAAVSKILWLKEHEPEVFAQTHQFASTQNIHLRQLGIEDPPCDLADAAYLGLLDVDKLCWSEELLNQLGIPPEKMPPLSASGKVVGKLSQKAADETGLAQGTPIVTAGGDLQCAGLGVGITRPGLVSVGVGSGADVMVYLDAPARHPQRALSCLPHVVEGAWELEGLCLTSGTTYKWFRDYLYQSEAEPANSSGHDIYSAMDAEAAQVPPGSHGVLVLPYLMGAGAPHWDPMVRGVILGITPGTDKKALMRAILEGICFEIRWILESVQEIGKPLSEIRLYGGPARSPLWNQIAADVFAYPVTQMATNQAGLIGAAICAGVGCGIFNSAQEGADAMVSAVKRYDPILSSRTTYDELFEIYKSTYLALCSSGVQGKIARFGSCL